MMNEMLFKQVIDNLISNRPLYYRINLYRELIFDKAGPSTFLLMDVNHDLNAIEEVVLNREELFTKLLSLDIFKFKFKSEFDNLIKFPIKGGK